MLEVTSSLTGVSGFEWDTKEEKKPMGFYATHSHREARESSDERKAYQIQRKANCWLLAGK